MKKNYWMILVLIFMISIPSAIMAANQVGVEVSNIHWWGTSENTIEKTESVEWQKSWLLNMMNDPDGGGTLTNPKITLTSDISFTGFYPDDPSFFTAGDGTYIWDFGAAGIDVPEPSHLSVGAGENSVNAPLIFSATRSVTPEILEDYQTIQEIVVNFTLKESLPDNIGFRMGLGGHLQAYGWGNLLTREVIYQEPAAGWSTSTDGVSAHWYPTVPIEVNKPYQFVAQIKVTKSSGLVGTPMFIPTVMIGYGNYAIFDQVIGNSVTIVHPDGVTGVFEVDNSDVTWMPFTSRSRFEASFYELLQSSGLLITGRVLSPDQYPVEGVKINGLPNSPTTDANGYFGEVVDYNWSGVITPTKPGYSFDPASITFNSIQTDQLDQNFIATGVNNDDSDDDGIPDDSDTCPYSDITSNVIINGCDTGVSNILLENGCTFSDLILQCAENAKNHGNFVSCVSSLTNDWKKAGLITGNEKGKIQNCAAKADIP